MECLKSVFSAEYYDYLNQKHSECFDVLCVCIRRMLDCQRQKHTMFCFFPLTGLKNKKGHMLNHGEGKEK